MTRRLKRYEKDEKHADSIQVEVMTLPNAEDDGDDSIVQRDFANFVKLFPGVRMVESKKNILLCVKRSHCFSMAKVDEDEWHVAISFPLSIFQGFAIALSLFGKTQQE